MRNLLFLFLLALVPSVASASDQFFRCEDGTVTNRPERLCSPYEPHGTVMIAPEGSRPANFAPFFERSMPSAPPVIVGQAKLASPDVCSLYQEWVTLNLQTGGGVTFRNTQDVPRWQSLSRMFTAIGRPQCD
jgi:hypothetical protein